jgi:tetratricopeptide (TPR) repeat protein
MKVAKSLLLLFAMLWLEIPSANANCSHTLRGVVITQDGTMVPEFTVTVRPVVQTPELIRRERFRNGEFSLQGLVRDKYQVIITAPLLVGVKLSVDFSSHEAARDYRIAILHRPRSGANLIADEPGYALSSKAKQQTVPDAAREAYQRGIDLHREGRLEEALVQYGSALRLYPNYVQVLGDLGTIYMLFNRPDSALAYLRRALEIDPSNNAIRLNIANALIARGNYNEALNHLEVVARADPGSTIPTYYKAKVLYLQKRYIDADQLLRRVLVENAALLDGWLLMIDVAMERNDHVTARECLIHLRQAMNSRLFSSFVDEQLSTLGS